MVDQSKMEAIDKLRASGKTVVECTVNGDGITADYMCPACGVTHVHSVAGMEAYQIRRKRSPCPQAIGRDTAQLIFHP